MPVVIPMTPDGARRVTCSVGGRRIVFRSYYSAGQDRKWLLDLYDIDETPLITGIALVPGSDNVIIGQGDTLNGYQLYVLASDNYPYEKEALGNTLNLLMYSPGEENWFNPGDPMMHIGRTILL